MREVDWLTIRRILLAVHDEFNLAALDSCAEERCEVRRHCGHTEDEELEGQQEGMKENRTLWVGT